MCRSAPPFLQFLQTWHPVCRHHNALLIPHSLQAGKPRVHLQPSRCAQKHPGLIFGCKTPCVLTRVLSCSYWSYLKEGWLQTPFSSPAVLPENLGKAPACYPCAVEPKQCCSPVLVVQESSLGFQRAFAVPQPSLCSLCFISRAVAVQLAFGFLSRRIALNIGVRSVCS